MSSKLSDDFQNGKRELQVSEESVADATLEKLKPFLKPDKTNDARLVLTQTVSKYHSGPLPPAEELEHLERILPGAANRVFEMAEREQQHRHIMGETIVTKEFALRGRGQWLAISAISLLLAAVGYLAYLGDTISAAGLGVATIVGVVGAFVTGKHIESRSEEAAEAPPEKPQKTPPSKTSNRKNRR